MNLKLKAENPSYINLVSPAATLFCDFLNFCLSVLSLSLFCHFSPLFESDVSSVWDYRSSVEQYRAPGGTAKSSVAAQVEHLRNWLTKQAQ